MPHIVDGSTIGPQVLRRLIYSREVEEMQFQMPFKAQWQAGFRAQVGASPVPLVNCLLGLLPRSSGWDLPKAGTPDWSHLEDSTGLGECLCHRHQPVPEPCASHGVRRASNGKVWHWGWECLSTATVKAQASSKDLAAVKQLLIFIKKV